MRSFSFLITFFFIQAPSIFSETSPPRADTNQTLTIFKRVSAFAPVKKVVWQKKWKENLDMGSDLRFPNGFPGRFRARHSWRTLALTEFMKHKDRYERIQSDRGLNFRGNSGTSYKEVRFNENEHSATFRGHDGFICYENYFKVGPTQFRPLRKVIVYTYRQMDQKMSLSWTIDFLNFQSVTNDPGRLELLIPKLGPRKLEAILDSNKRY